jgi:glycosyltransferase involved in cell wall biosynthesis
MSVYRYMNGIVERASRSGRPLKIAQLAPLYESVPPKLYGGTERVVSYLTEALLARGHEVTLFASGDSTCRAPLHAGWPTSLRLDGLGRLGPSYQLRMLSDVYERAADFDIIHSHLDYWSFPFSRLVSTPTISTMHGRLDLPDLYPIYQYYRDVPVVSISDAQRCDLPELNWIGTVHHGLPVDLLRFSPGPGRYLAFLGRICPEKRPDLAIEVARRVGVPLKLAAKVDDVDRAYFDGVIKPLLSPPDIEYIGEINENEKSEFLGGALALLFTIDWPEPFGLVMIESLACGTPVIARPCGSVQEIIRDGVTGFVTPGVDDLAACVLKAEGLSREACRREFENRFTAQTMACNYESLYCGLLAEGNLPEESFPDERRGSAAAEPTFSATPK